MDRREDKGVQEQEHGLKAAVITVSDRSFRGEREDKSGPVLSAILSENGYEITEELLLPDEEDRIAEELVRLCDEKGPDVIFTTGGTGFSNRDRTPEATLRVAERNAPGIAEALRAESAKYTPNAMLSRGASVIRGKTIIINLPGSPKAVREGLEFLLPRLFHGIMILRGEADG
ncbi:MAG: MogA/MoaB family molybdenum cofactor biosynthesis protein [Lachnospiraceae bacterium]|nr:MogA/MoaB family molybdenum cofactor biosynthesis protein [Lachnospiraceae bacterium]